MEFSLWLSLVLICLLGAMTPGPSLAVVIQHTVGSSRLHGFCTAWAHALGVALYALCSLLGLSIVLQQSPLLFKVIAYGGAAYLAWLGFKAISSKGGLVNQLKSQQAASYSKAAKDGAMISLLNPKLGLFFLALFSQYVSASSGLSSQVALVSTPLIIDGLWYSLVAFLLTIPKILSTIRQQAIWIDRVSGVILLILAVRVVWSV
ncbi:LysE family translocator [Spartinivicinus poritis]|uniref:LysE family translocator n=1 Tax=Spartinivicinus poritis TaxID=2994640 RepID=A0ABT5UAA9_9GAMM|nr:LysE family translocator [Spartinivicinus sp. A2-2]MDE1463297.1 LysE family translocator [Spartinivicinus sp. A2-2]